MNAQGYELWTSLVARDKGIKAPVADDQKSSRPAGGIVFVGSSSIKRWTTLSNDFPEQPVINHGFARPQIFDSVVFADTIVTPLKSSADRVLRRRK